MSNLKHKHVRELEPGLSAWAVLCSPEALNSKVFDVEWRRKNTSYVWDEVTCQQCLRLRKMSDEESYTLRKGLKFLAKGEQL